MEYFSAACGYGVFNQTRVYSKSPKQEFRWSRQNAAGGPIRPLDTVIGPFLFRILSLPLPQFSLLARRSPFQLYTDLAKEVYMLRKSIAAVPLLAVLVWAAGTGAEQDAKSVIESATTALGASNLKTVEFSGSGF